VKAGFNLRRILLMVTPMAILLVAIVITPMVLERSEDRREQLHLIQSEREKLYRARLEPCNPVLLQTDIKELALRPGEVAVDIFPAFAAPEGFRLSRRSVSGYRGAAGVRYPPPPPPPPGIAEVREPDTDATPEYMLLTAVALPQPLGTRVVEAIKAEIDLADAEPAMGLDGVTYVLRYGAKCAMTWSPQPDTRAHKIVDLVDALDRLSKEDARQVESLHADITMSLAQLESDTRELAE
jgi:hypothetical protein